MANPDEDAEREVREAVRALEDVLARVRRARRGSVGIDVEEVRRALDVAERRLSAARERLERTRRSLDRAGSGQGSKD